MSNPLNPYASPIQYPTPTASQAPGITAGVPSGWGQVKPGFDLELPSGALVRIERMEIADLLGLGILDSIDTFTQKLLPSEGKHGADQSAEQELGNRIMNDLSQFSDVLEMVDKVIARAVVKPQLHLAPFNDNGEPLPLQDGKIYAHLVPLEDKMAIFQAVIPEMDDTFPDSDQSAAGVADLEDVQGVPSQADSAPGI